MPAYIQYQDQELEDWSQLPPSIKFYLEKACKYIRKEEIGAILVKKYLPAVWTFKTRKTSPADVPHYLLDIWSKKGQTFPRLKVFPGVWSLGD